MPNPDPARVLTFHPSRDDPAALKAFLSSTFQRYKEQSQTDGILRACGINRSAGVSRSNCLPVARDTSKKRKASILVPRNSFKDHADATYPALPAPVMPGTRSPDTTQYPAKATKKAKKTVGPVKLSTATRCSLLRAKQAIDTRAPDPELEAPPDETEVEKRRRLERINGRRKRTKKLIEIDQLHEQVGALTNRNQNVKKDNDALRQARDALRHALLLRDRKVAGATENIKTAVADASKALQRSAKKPTASEEKDKGESQSTMAANVPNKYHQKSSMHQEQETFQRLIPQLLQRQQNQELRMPASTLRAACSLRILPPPPQKPPSNAYHDLLRSSLALQQQQQLASLSTSGNRNMVFLNQTLHQPKAGDIDGPALLRQRPAFQPGALPQISQQVVGAPHDATRGNPQHDTHDFAAQLAARHQSALSGLLAPSSAAAAPGGGSIESLLLRQHCSDMQGQLALVAAMVRFAPTRHELTNDHHPSEEDHQQA